MYATISREFGVIRHISWYREECEACMYEQAHNGDSCAVVEIPQLMLDDFGSQLLEFWKEEVSAK